MQLARQGFARQIIYWRSQTCSSIKHSILLDVAIVILTTSSLVWQAAIKDGQAVNQNSLLINYYNKSVH